MTAIAERNGTRELTHSSTTCFKTCRRRYYYQYVHGVTRDYPSAPLRLGSAFHYGLDALAVTGDLEAAVNAVRGNYDEMPAWAVEPEDQFAWRVECETAVRLVCGYAWRWQNDGITVIASEQPFDLSLVNPKTGRASTTRRLRGKIDKIVRLPDGRLALMEHKTTGDPIGPDSDYWKRLRMDQQISLYFLAAQRLGYDVQTVIYDVCHKPDISPRKLSTLRKDERPDPETGKYFGEKFTLHEIGNAMTADRETPGMFGARLSADIASRPDHYFARMEIPRLGSDLEEFAYEIWQMQRDIAACEREGHWYRNTNACLHPYKCEVWDLCSQGIDPAGALPAGYVKVDYVHKELI